MKKTIFASIAYSLLSTTNLMDQAVAADLTFDLGNSDDLAAVESMTSVAAGDSVRVVVPENAEDAFAPALGSLEASGSLVVAGAEGTWLDFGIEQLSVAESGGVYVAGPDAGAAETPATALRIGEIERIDGVFEVGANSLASVGTDDYSLPRKALAEGRAYLFVGSDSVIPVSASSAVAVGANARISGSGRLLIGGAGTLVLEEGARISFEEGSALAAASGAEVVIKTQGGLEDLDFSSYFGFSGGGLEQSIDGLSEILFRSWTEEGRFSMQGGRPSITAREYEFKGPLAEFMKKTAELVKSGTYVPSYYKNALLYDGEKANYAAAEAAALGIESSPRALLVRSAAESGAKIFGYVESARTAQLRYENLSPEEKKEAGRPIAVAAEVFSARLDSDVEVLSSNGRSERSMEGFSIAGAAERDGVFMGAEFKVIESDWKAPGLLASRTKGESISAVIFAGKRFDGFIASASIFAASNRDEASGGTLGTVASSVRDDELYGASAQALWSAAEGVDLTASLSYQWFKKSSFSVEDSSSPVMDVEVDSMSSVLANASASVSRGWFRGSLEAGMRFGGLEEDVRISIPGGGASESFAGAKLDRVYAEARASAVFEVLDFEVEAGAFAGAGSESRSAGARIQAEMIF